MTRACLSTVGEYILTWNEEDLRNFARGSNRTVEQAYGMLALKSSRDNDKRAYQSTVLLHKDNL